MGSEKGRKVQSWTKTPFRRYLRGMAYALKLRGLNETSLIAKVYELVPDWKNEFIEIDGKPITDHALFERGEKAVRYPKERPVKSEHVAIWEHAARDISAGKCTFERNTTTAVVHVLEKPQMSNELRVQDTPTITWSYLYMWGNDKFCAIGITREKPHKRLREHAKGAFNKFENLTFFQVYADSSIIEAKFKTDFRSYCNHHRGERIGSTEVFEMPFSVADFHIRETARFCRIGVRKIEKDEMEEMLKS